MSNRRKTLKQTMAELLPLIRTDLRRLKSRVSEDRWQEAERKDAVALAKHYSGRHNQKTHGRRYSAAGELKSGPGGKNTKPQAGGGASGGSKLDAIYATAPKGETEFTSHVLGKVQSGEISFADGQKLWARAKADREAGQSAGGSFKQYSQSDLAHGGAVDKKWSNWEKGLSKAERESLADYKSEPFDGRKTNYDNINGALRGSGKHDGETRTAVKNLDAAINKGRVPEDTLVFRGMGKSVLGGDPSSMVGKTFTDKGFISTSLDQKTSQSFSGKSGVVTRINIPKGTRAAYMDTLNRTGKDKEYELILPRGSSFKITGVRTEGGRTIVDMDLI